MVFGCCAHTVAPSPEQFPLYGAKEEEWRKAATTQYRDCHHSAGLLGGCRLFKLLVANLPNHGRENGRCFGRLTKKSLENRSPMHWDFSFIYFSVVGSSSPRYGTLSPDPSGIRKLLTVVLPLGVCVQIFWTRAALDWRRLVPHVRLSEICTSKMSNLQKSLMRV
jgi:hypothetical protein